MKRWGSSKIRILGVLTKPVSFAELKDGIARYLG